MSGQLFNIYLQSQVASHTAAGALLFTQLLLIGCPCEVQPEAMIASALSILTDLTQIHVQCPFNYGVLDGLLMLLNQMLNQGEQMIADQFLETRLWDMLWSKVSNSLKPQAEEEEALLMPEPDWGLLSPGGFISVLNLASRMLTMSSQNCVALFIKDDSIMFDSLSYMLSDRFLTSLKTTYANQEASNRSKEFMQPSLMSADDEDNVDCIVNEFIITICQILCFPFAIEPNEDVVSRMYKIIKEFNLFHKIVNACILHGAHLSCDIPFSLISRLVLTDEDLVQLMIDQLNNSNQVKSYKSLNKR